MARAALMSASASAIWAPHPRRIAMFDRNKISIGPCLFETNLWDHEVSRRLLSDPSLEAEGPYNFVLQSAGQKLPHRVSF